MKQELSSTPARELDTFIENDLLPDTRFRAEVNAAINIICDFLKKRCFQGATDSVMVSKVVKSGSLGKGTDVNGRSDAELVVFVNNLNSFEDQLKKWGEFIQEIKKQLRKLQCENIIRLEFVIKGEQWPNSLALNFRLRSPDLDQEMEFDVLLAYDILDHVSINKKSMIKIYREFIATCTSLGLEGEFYTCFTELQQNFLKDRPDKLKSLIRLVKHWYQLCEEKLRKPLPHQYALELLTVYAWERGSRAPEFNTAQGFRTVLELVKNQRHLRIYWTVSYDFEDQDISNYLHGQLRRARPVILDPADPTRNVAGGNPVGWWLLAEEARAWLKFSCFKNCDNSTVRSWKVPMELDVPHQQHIAHPCCSCVRHVGSDLPSTKTSLVVPSNGPQWLLFMASFTSLRPSMETPLDVFVGTFPEMSADCFLH
ncbi:2'-5'-oligoadenylate synthase 1A-like [Onychomys torridus]|uniref:2'-5'-oligoadenylate synthase 1A-like n=1 Tax=Onychomys torridus TaxID=38674 RepID=UPI00167FC580|nr:2'-5'-oligoadenylate synthase 1A-like [Onychomys torridus]